MGREKGEEGGRREGVRGEGGSTVILLACCRPLYHCSH